jgi:DNA gyrase subunit A
MVMGTKLGEVKKTPLKYFANVRRGGLNAMDLEAADELVSVKLAGEEDHAMVITAQGKSLRFSVRALRSASRQSGGVRGVRLAQGDRVVALDIAKKDEAMLVITSQGFGKRTPVAEYPLQGRGGQGVITFKTTPKTGELVSARLVNPSQELMLISTNGIVLRTAVEQISLQGRPTQGVTLMDVEEGETVAAVTVVDMAKDYRGEAPLPTGVSAEPGAAGAPKKTRARAKAPVAKGKAAPAKGKPPVAKGKPPVAKSKAPAAKAKPPVAKAKTPAAQAKATPAQAKPPAAQAKKPAPLAKAQAKKPAPGPARPGGGPQRKSPPRGR